jgi:5'-nucleotidase
VGVFGLVVYLNGLVPQSNFQGIVMKDPYESAKKVIQSLNEAHCDFIVCLSHLGYQYQDGQKPSDVLLAQKVPGIDLILGGHTHTFMDEPTKVTNVEGKDVWIHQVGWAGVRLGVIEVSANKFSFWQRKIQ